MSSLEKQEVPASGWSFSGSRDDEKTVVRTKAKLTNKNHGENAGEIVPKAL
jgi:hypothetical protein